MKRSFYIALLLAFSFQCATKKYVSNEIEASETRTQSQVEDVKRLVEETQTEFRNRAKELNLKIEGLETNTEDLSRKTAENTESIAKLGHLSFKKTLSDAGAHFKSDDWELNDAAKTELDKFAQLIKKQNRLVHIEIQGHTDSLGKESYNLILGEKRARAVHDYLYSQHDIPLHLMDVISLGSSKPVAENKTREDRAKNRRVVLVVRVQI